MYQVPIIGIVQAIHVMASLRVETKESDPIALKFVKKTPLRLHAPFLHYINIGKYLILKLNHNQTCALSVTVPFYIRSIYFQLCK